MKSKRNIVWNSSDNFVGAEPGKSHGRGGWGGGDFITVTNMLSLQSLLVTTLLLSVTQVRMALWRNFTDVLYTELFFSCAGMTCWLGGNASNPAKQNGLDKNSTKSGWGVGPRRRENIRTAHHRLMTNNWVGTISLAADWRVTPT